MLPRQLDSVDFYDDRVVLHDPTWAHPIVETNNGLVEYKPGKFYKQCVLERDGLEMYVDFFQFRVSRVFFQDEPWVLSYHHDDRGVEFFGRRGRVMSDAAMEAKVLNYAVDYMTLPTHVLKCLQVIWFLLSEEQAYFKFHLATLRKVIFEDEFRGVGIPTGFEQKMPFDVLRRRLDSLLLACKEDDKGGPLNLESRREVFLSVVFGWTLLDVVLFDARDRDELAYFSAFFAELAECLYNWEHQLGLSPRKQGRLFGLHWLVDKVRDIALEQAKTCLDDHDRECFDSMLDELKEDERDHNDRASKRSARRKRQKEHRRNSKEAHANKVAARRDEAKAAAARRAKDTATAAVERAMEIASRLADGGDKADAARRLGESLTKHHALCRDDVRQRAVSKRAEWMKREPPDDELVCPILLEEMRDPVVLAGDGKTYERSAIEAWLTKSRLSPLLGLELDNVSLSPNERVRAAVLARRSR